MRFQPDLGGGPAATGNTWVGLRSNAWGSITLGRHDLHYGKQPDDIAAKAGALHATAVSLMDYAARGTSAVAITSRTANNILWSSPSWGGFTLAAALSLAPFGSEGDMVAGATQKGKAFNFNPAFTASNWQIGASLWSAESEATNAREEDGKVLYGYARFGGWKVGAAVNQSEIHTAGTVTSDRRALTIPVSFTTGAHNFYAHYTKANKDDAASLAGQATDAKMMAFAYVYDLSKRTSVGITFAKITNSAQAAYNFFTAGGALGSADAIPANGEDPQLLQATIRHAF
jgi:predicted porin